jgi:UDP-N-acetylglucosamine 2-epimerase (non-hydrolysing)
MKVLSIIGARPQFIKASVVCEAFAQRGITEILVNSGQHYDSNMSDVFFKALNIPKAHYDLGVGSGTHAEMTAKIMMTFEPIVMKEKPECVIVYGDTNTTLAGALVAAKLKVPVAHIEAGIRMLPKDMPEEINRVLVDHISTKLFCASRLGINNLAAEGIHQGVIFSGDVMFDVFKKTQPYFNYDLLKEFHLEENRYVVVTLHRDYNVDNPEILKTIIQQLSLVAQHQPVLFSVHPRTRKRISEFGLEKNLQGITLLEPLGYFEMMGLVSKSKNIITDSGGLQKESYFAGKQAVVVMPDTGWQELVDKKINVLSAPQDIFSKWQQLHSANFEENIYGDGRAAHSIAENF